MAEIKDENHEDFLGKCEHCDKMLFEGDTGLRCDDGPILCADHAPTWADAKRQWEEQFDEKWGDDPERRTIFMQTFAAHIAAGGSPDDKFTVPL